MALPPKKKHEIKPNKKLLSACYPGAQHLPQQSQGYDMQAASHQTSTGIYHAISAKVSVTSGMHMWAL